MIKAAAIRKGSNIYSGPHHQAIKDHYWRANMELLEGSEGFVDDNNKFLTREEARTHAIDCGQVKDGDKNLHPLRLYSFNINFNKQPTP